MPNDSDELSRTRHQNVCGLDEEFLDAGGAAPREAIDEIGKAGDIREKHGGIEFVRSLIWREPGAEAGPCPPGVPIRTITDRNAPPASGRCPSVPVIAAPLSPVW